MPAAGKIEIKIGALSFAAEGEQEWLGEQLAKVIAAAGTMPAAPATPTEDADPGAAATPRGKANNVSLSTYLKAKGGETRQVQRFLATAGWLRNRGETNLSTTAVAKALAENHQKRLGNPADCLNQNCGKGFCEKSGDGFFITPEGLKELGEAEA